MVLQRILTRWKGRTLVYWVDQCCLKGGNEIDISAFGGRDDAAATTCIYAAVIALIFGG